MKRDRVSRVARRMWNDEKFRQLSAAPPNGQTLWLRLLTGPEGTCIPGVIVAWEAGLAQSLGWKVEGFRKAFGEAFAKGMAEGDFSAGLVWLPKAIEHNRPESPNVVKSWRTTWLEVPECELKVKVFQDLKAFVEAMGEGFAKAFRQAFAEGFEEGYPKPSPNTRARAPSPDQGKEEEGGTESGSGSRSDQPDRLDRGRAPSGNGKVKPSPKVPLPEGFEPSETEIGIAAKLALNELTERAKFIDNARAKDLRYSDWLAAYRTWLRRAPEFAPRTVNGRAPGLVDHEAQRIEANARQMTRENLKDRALAGEFGERAKSEAEAGNLNLDELERWYEQRKAKRNAAAKSA